MLKEHIEREFKSEISKDEYSKLLEKYQLADKTFVQTNYYFDTLDDYFKDNDKTLRIRKKVDSIKLTLKEKIADGSSEKSIIIDNNTLNEYINNGFIASMFGFELKVNLIGKLQTTRAKFSYLNGVVFLDKNDYYQKEDYEIEFEINDGFTNIEGESSFNHFLEENNLVFKKQKSKSKRAILLAKSQKY